MRITKSTPTLATEEAPKREWTPLEELQAENARLRTALGYYADDRVYETHSMFTHPVMLDKGKRAKEALGLIGVESVSAL